MSEQHNITIGQLFPKLTGEELKVAEENLQAYLGLVLRIYTRLEQEENSVQGFDRSKTFA